MSEVIVNKTHDGRIIGTSFGIGVDMHGSKYTPQEIMSIGMSMSKSFPEKTEPYWIDGFNDYVWVRYDRLSHTVCQAVRQRVLMDSFHRCNPNDLSSYLGVSDYVSTWPMYLETSMRIAALSRHFKTLNNLRLLELGCGCGHQLLPLAAHGCQVHGMELNPVMYSSRHELLRERVVFGDALYEPCLVYKQGMFDVIVVAMAGFVNFSDLPEFFNNLSFLVERGLLVVDLIDKKGTGKILPVAMYKQSLRQAGFSPKYTLGGQLVCIKDQLRGSKGS